MSLVRYGLGVGKIRWGGAEIAMLFISAIGSDAVHAEPVVEPLDIVDV
jgi:hypothetical protein